MRLKTKYNSEGEYRFAAASIVEIVCITIKNDGQLIFWIKGLSEGTKVVIDPVQKKVLSAGWKSKPEELREKAIGRIRVEIGARKYDFIDFSEEEIQELIEGEGLE